MLILDEDGTGSPLELSTSHSDPNIVSPMSRLPLESTCANQLRQVPSSLNDAPLTPEHEFQSIWASPLARLPQLLPYGAISSIMVYKLGTVTTCRQTSRHLG